MKTILIISNTKDVHANIVFEELLKRNEKVVRLDTDLYSKGDIFITLTDTEDNTLQIGDDIIKLSDIKSVWYRRPREIEPQVNDPRQYSFAQKELTELLENLYLSIPQAFWVNNSVSLDTAKKKFPQLQLAKKVGLKIPRTSITNSPKEAREFIKSCSNKVIYKTIHAPRMAIDRNDTKQLGLATSIITKESMKQLDLLAKTGGIFQEYTEKEYEIRVSIFGEELFAARINSQKTTIEKAKVDWRMGVGFDKDLIVESYDLPDDISKKCLQICRELNLEFSAIDLIKTPDGEYVFLEINPNGQWYWVERMTGQPLLESMIRLLKNE